MLTKNEREELEHLRELRKMLEISPIEEAFMALEKYMSKPVASGIDSVMSRRGFELLARCVIALRERIK